MRYALEKPYRDNGGTYSGHAYCVKIGHIQLYYSYSTLIGVTGGGAGIRRHNEWGPTTGKHINMLGIKDLPEGEESEVEDTATSLLATLGRENIFKLEN